MASDVPVTVELRLRDVPHEKLDVLIAATENDGLESVRGFNEFDGMAYKVRFGPLPLDAAGVFLQKIHKVLVDESQPVE